MDREALAALEKRVEALRVHTAERAVFARSLASEPLRNHTELSTALLAIVVFVVFIAGRQIGMMVAGEARCPALGPNTQAIITLDRRSCFGPCSIYTVTLDTNGDMTWYGMAHVAHIGEVSRHVDPAAVRTLANALATSCFFETAQPPRRVTDVATTRLTFRVGAREKTISHNSAEPVTLCGSHMALEQFYEAIDKLAGAKALIGEPGAIRDTFR